MRRIVVFLGAGASAAVGLPTTNGIFPILLERLIGRSSDTQALFLGDTEDQEHLKRCLTSIFPGLARYLSSPAGQGLVPRELPSITDVLSVIDYHLLAGNAPTPDLTLSELTKARTLLERAVFELLVRKGQYATEMEGVPDIVSDHLQQIRELPVVPTRSAAYDAEVQCVANWLLDLSSRTKVTLISTNYDIEVEQELFNRIGYDVFGKVDFGMSVRDPEQGTVYQRPENARLSIYKLHGSLNWLRCNLCDNVYLNPVGAISYLSFLLGDDRDRYKEQWPWLAALEADDANMCHCGYRPLRHVIVAPSFVREVRDPVLLQIWHSAVNALREGDEWVIVGYSLTPEDVAIRSMFLRGYQGRDGPSPPRIKVVQLEKKEPEISRYALLFPEYDYVAGGLRAHIGAERTRPTGLP